MSQKIQNQSTFQNDFDTRKNKDEEFCKQPLLINDIAESNQTGIAHHARELDQAISNNDSSAKIF